MTLSDPRRITDELLSAYIDDEVTEQERAIVEAAITSNEEVAWRLTSLRQTVTLLRDSTQLVLPRSFALTFDQVRSTQSDEQLVVAGGMEGVPMAASAQPKTAPIPQQEGGFWADVAEGWRRIWQGGNPMLRNAAAVSFALMLLVASGGQLINDAVTQPADMMATAREAAPAATPASDSAPNMTASSAASEGTTATSAEAVALAPTAEVAAAKSPDTESLQAQAASTSEAPAPESARILQSQAEPAADASASDTYENDEATSDTNASDAASESTESMVVESAPAEGDAAPEESVVAVAAAAPAEDAAVEQPAAEEAPTEDQAGAAAMAAPMPLPGESAPPLIANPAPGMDAGGGARPESGGGGPEGDLPPGASSDGALVPQQAYGFDVAATSEPTTLPLEEAEGVVSDTVEPYIALEAESDDQSAEAVADVAVTPAVEIAEAEAAIASEIEPTATPESVALVAPGAITSSKVVENVQLEEGVASTSEEAFLPVVWIAQATMLLLTIFFASLWWRSRKTR